VDGPLTGKVALVTTVSREAGIGAAIARKLAGQGADVALHTRSNIASAELLATELRSMGRKTTVFQVDFSDGDSLPDFVEAAWSWQSGVDIWINNAGLDGHSTAGHLVLMREYIALMKPDVVIFLIGLNDVGRTDLNQFELENVRGGI